MVNGLLFSLQNWTKNIIDENDPKGSIDDTRTYKEMIKNHCTFKSVAIFGGWQFFFYPLYFKTFLGPQRLTLNQILRSVPAGGRDRGRWWAQPFRSRKDRTGIFQSFPQPLLILSWVLPEWIFIVAIYRFLAFLKRIEDLMFDNLETLKYQRKSWRIRRVLVSSFPLLFTKATKVTNTDKTSALFPEAPCIISAMHTSQKKDFSLHEWKCQESWLIL